jgi:hypothetical protein
MPTRTEQAESGASPAMLATMRAWRAAHPRATFAEIEREAMRQVAALRTELIATALTVDEPEQAPRCTACGQAMVRNGTHTRLIVTSQQERVPITGHRYRCSACGAELFPPG